MNDFYVEKQQVFNQTIKYLLSAFKESVFLYYFKQFVVLVSGNRQRLVHVLQRQFVKLAAGVPYGGDMSDGHQHRLVAAKKAVPLQHGFQLVQCAAADSTADEKSTEASAADSAANEESAAGDNEFLSWDEQDMIDYMKAEGVFTNNDLLYGKRNRAAQ